MASNATASLTRHADEFANPPSECSLAIDTKRLALAISRQHRRITRALGLDTELDGSRTPMPPAADRHTDKPGGSQGPGWGGTGGRSFGGMAKNNEDRYVVPNENGGWDVVKENHKRASAHFDTQKEAISRAKEIVENTGRGLGEVRIQGKNGQFRDSDSGSRNETKAKDHR